MKTKTASEQNLKLDNNRVGKEKENKERGKNSIQNQLNNEGVLMTFLIITRPVISRDWVTICQN